MNFARLLTVAAFAWIGLQTADVSAAPSFNCKKAKGLVEKQICGNPEFEPLDRDIASLYARSAVEQRIDLLDASLDGDELGAALDDEAGVEAVAFVHLERKTSEVAEPFLANLEERLSLALQLADGGDDVPAATARRSVLLRHRLHVRAGGRRDALRSSRGPRTQVPRACCPNP